VGVNGGIVVEPWRVVVVVAIGKRQGTKKRSEGRGIRNTLVKGREGSKGSKDGIGDWGKGDGGAGRREFGVCRLLRS